jgi:hypothetical protein
LPTWWIGVKPPCVRIVVTGGRRNIIR